MLSKVLIATDGSAHAQKAVKFGSDLAAKYGAEVVLVHVLLRQEMSESLRHMAEVEYGAEETAEPLYEVLSNLPEARFPQVNPRLASGRTSGEALRAIAEHLLAGAEQIARERGVSSIDKRVEDGDPVNRILEVAKKVNADLIVTGARGLSDLKALAIGSVSHKLSHLSPITCMTVR